MRLSAWRCVAVRVRRAAAAPSLTFFASLISPAAAGRSADPRGARQSPREADGSTDTERTKRKHRLQRIQEQLCLRFFFFFFLSWCRSSVSTWLPPQHLSAFSLREDPHTVSEHELTFGWICFFSEGESFIF